jgi:phage head maturation protease
MGGHAEATLNPSRSDVQILRAAVEDGDIDEMSFSLVVVRQSWSAEWDRRWITEVNMHHGDCSPCNFGANSHTAGLLALRSRAESVDEIERAYSSIDEVESAFASLDAIEGVTSA